ncbi:MAG: NERD domain-containing protein, partial [Fibrobacter sp.]|nr:NERD domain-containing protein [Fibrobacter sp.]
DVAQLLGDDWNVWMNVRLRFRRNDFQGDMDREVDAILYHRKFGMLLVECKDGRISTAESLDSLEGFVWKQNHRELSRSPVEQVQSLIHPLHDYFSEMIPRNEAEHKLNRVRVQWAVCFCDMDDLEKIGNNALTSNHVIFKADLESPDSFKEKILDVLNNREVSYGGKAYPNDYLDDENFQKLVSFIGCFDEPSWPELWDMQSAVRVKPTAIQETLMDSISRNPRMRIEGVAGSGKSLLVQWEATRLSREGKRVAVLCYNDLLADEMQRNFKAAGLDETCVTADSFMRLAAKYVRLAKVPGTPRKEPAEALLKREYYGNLPGYFCKALEILREKKKARFFDALIIDEGQDFENAWLDYAMQLLKNPEQGVVRFFYDPNQTLYDGRPVLGNETFNAMPVMVLKRGFRCTKKILEWIYDTLSIRIPCYENTVTGRAVETRIYSNPEEQITLLNREVERLHKKGVENKDILVVSLRSKSHSGLKELDDDMFSWSDVGDDLSSQKINIVSAYRYKGLDKRVVILADFVPEQSNPGEPYDNAHLILVGATRAKEHLVVLKQRKVL